MGHFLFVILHIMALFFMVWGLFITIPAHIIYAVLLSKSNGVEEAGKTNVVLVEREHKKCPFCAESIKIEAVLCRFCGKELSRDFENQKEITHQENIKNSIFYCTDCKNSDSYYDAHNKIFCPHCNKYVGEKFKSNNFDNSKW